MASTKTFKLSRFNLSNKNQWPNWLFKAWCVEWGAPGSFEPIPGTEEFRTFGKRSGETRFSVGDLIAPSFLT